jgi:SAM-dependent methyltransferase
VSDRSSLLFNTATAVASHSCRLCGEPALQEFETFRALPRVTSDCKPWSAGGRLTVCTSCGATQKLADAAWLAEIATIYDRYTIYHQSEGAEQPIFSGAQKVPVPRSVSLVNYLVQQLGPRDRLSLLDFGCGTGAALRTFAQRHPGWALYGSELSDRSLPALRMLPSFVDLFTCPPEEIPARFDLITLIHSLEHVLEPVATLAALANKLEERGHLFVQVPDCGSTPYDLVIADHLMHFSSDTLRFAGERAGCDTVVLSDTVLTKELSWIGERRLDTSIAVATPDPRPALARTRRQLQWLHAQAAAAEEVAANSRCFGIFGTSTSGTWLHNLVAGQAQFFVDEDPGRIGRRHMGLPILSVQEIPDGADVYVPLLPRLAASVAARLGRRGVRFFVPPQMGSEISQHEAALS